MSAPGTVGIVFDKPEGPVRLDSRGRWWINRRDLALDEAGEIGVQIADGRHVTTIDGSPDQLRNLARAIVAQVDSALANTDEEPSEADLARYYNHDGGEDPVVRQALRDAGRPGL